MFPCRPHGPTSRQAAVRSLPRARAPGRRPDPAAPARAGPACRELVTCPPEGKRNCARGLCRGVTAGRRGSYGCLRRVSPRGAAGEPRRGWAAFPASAGPAALSWSISVRGTGLGHEGHVPGWFPRGQRAPPHPTLVVRPAPPACGGTARAPARLAPLVSPTAGRPRPRTRMRGAGRAGRDTSVIWWALGGAGFSSWSASPRRSESPSAALRIPAPTRCGQRCLTARPGLVGAGSGSPVLR